MRFHARTLLAWLLVFLMIFTCLPLGSITVYAANEDGTHYLAFASDRHGNTTAISEYMGTFPSEVEYVCLAGDMVGSGGKDTPSYNTSTVKDEVTALFSEAEVDIVWGTHDAGANDDAGIMNGATAGSSGLIYTDYDDAGVAYYVYGIAYYDMSDADNAQTAAAAFSDWAAGVDPSIPIFMACHMPLHQRRGDNKGAANWLTAINAAAESHDIVYFWGHNHTGESKDDTNAYLLTLGAALTPEGGSATTINFTYMNAGYLNARQSATLVTLTDSEISLQKYVSGSASDTYYATITRTGSDESHTHTRAEAVEENRVEATCAAAGSYDSVVYCSECGEELSRVTITLDIVDHTAAEAVEENRVEATCAAAGSYDSVVYCSECEGEISRETIILDKLAHTEGDAVTETVRYVTCTEAGRQDTVVYCTVCNEEISRTVTEIPALGHDYNAEGICTRCGAIKAPACTISAARGTSSRKITLTGQLTDYANLSDYNITGHGLIYITATKLGTKTLTINTSGRTKVGFTSYKADGSFSYTFTGSAVSTKYVCRTWVSYVDGSGNTVYVYSDPITVSYSTLN